MEADPLQLDQELRRSHASLRRCCGIVYLRYEPGCTYAACSDCGRKVARPDWDPAEATRLWNEFPKTDKHQ